jgi:hypothetical protein
LLGHNKPKKLDEAERAIWLLAFNLAAGMDKRQELAQFFERLAEADVLVDEQAEGTWITQSTFASATMYDL